MLSAKKLVKKQKKAVARREETVRLIFAARMAVDEILKGVRTQRRLEELQKKRYEVLRRNRSWNLTGEAR